MDVSVYKNGVVMSCKERCQTLVAPRLCKDVSLLSRRNKQHVLEVPSQRVDMG
jgi:hypothetical protein